MRWLTYDECNNQVTMYMYIKTLHCISLICLCVYDLHINKTDKLFLEDNLYILDQQKF